MVLDVFADLFALLVGGKFLHLQLLTTLINRTADCGRINAKVFSNLRLRVLDDAVGMVLVVPARLQAVVLDYFTAESFQHTTYCIITHAEFVGDRLLSYG